MPSSLIYRLPLRSEKPGVASPSEQVQYCRERRIIGLGWGIHPAPFTLTECLQRIREDTSPGWGPRAASTIKRFAEAPNGGLVWTRDVDGTYMLSELSSQWRYDNSAAAGRVDVHQVRDVHWAPKALLDVEVPGAVVRAFSSRGSSFQQIDNEIARQFSRYLFAELTGQRADMEPPTAEAILHELLDPYDVEDLVYTYLQTRGFLVLPASRRRDTPTYEYALVHKETGQLAVAQVKTGSNRSPAQAATAA